jgi:ferritin-like protein
MPVRRLAGAPEVNAAPPAAYDRVNAGRCIQETRNQEENEMSSVGYHEPIEELSDETRDMHRAIVSLMEELEAVDWYNQRADACKDLELKAILSHNRDEEKEHASMVLEWIRRNDPKFSGELKDYLFTKKPIAHQ